MAPTHIVAFPDMETVLAPSGSRGKFVQLQWRGTEYLLFASRELHRFHNQILAQFLEQHGVPHHWADKETLEIDSDELRVIGGGRYRSEPRHHLLELSDNSQAYGRFHETGIAAKIRAADSPLSGYSIKVGD